MTDHGLGGPALENLIKCSIRLEAYICSYDKVYLFEAIL
jgi:hypothetical protein